MKFLESSKIAFKTLVTYFVTLIELLICGAIASPIASFIVIFLSDFFGGGDGAYVTAQLVAYLSVLYGPTIAFPFLAIIVCPFVTFLKCRTIDEFSYWFIGITALGATYPIIFSALKQAAVFFGIDELYYKFGFDNYDEYQVFFSSLFIVASSFGSIFIYGIYSFQRSISRDL